MIGWVGELPNEPTAFWGRGVWAAGRFGMWCRLVFKLNAMGRDGWRMGWKVFMLCYSMAVMGVRSGVGG